MYGLINETGLLIVTSGKPPEPLGGGEYLINEALAGPWLGVLTPVSDVPDEAVPGAWRRVDGQWVAPPEPESPPEPEPSIEQQITDLQIAVVEQFEENLALHEELTNAEIAIVELYEMMIGGAENG